MRERAQTNSGGESKSPTGSILAGVVVAAMLCGVGLFHVYCKIAALEAGYRLGKVEDAHKLLERENVALKLQLATLRSAAHIETTARTNLGMTTPAPQAIFTVGGPIAPIVHTTPKTRKATAAKKANAPLALLAPGDR